MMQDIKDIFIPSSVFEKIQSIPQNYFNQPNFEMYLKAISEELDLIYQAIYDLRYLRTINEAEGINLDHVGEIVGEPRKYTVNLDIGFFAFSDNTLGSGFNEGFWYDSNVLGGSVGETRTDIVYRNAIKAKIKRNIGSCTPEEIINIVKILTNSETVNYSSVFPCGVSIYYSNQELTDNQRQYMSEFLQVALPSGVLLTNFDKIT